MKTTPALLDELRAINAESIASGGCYLDSDAATVMGNLTGIIAVLAHQLRYRGMLKMRCVKLLCSWRRTRRWRVGLSPHCIMTFASSSPPCPTFRRASAARTRNGLTVYAGSGSVAVRV